MRKFWLAVGSLGAAAAAAYAAMFYYKNIERRMPQSSPSVGAARGVKLPAPGAMVVSPLAAGKSTPGFTNEGQERYLQEQAAKLGIQRLGHVTNLAGEQAHEVVAPIGYEEGVERTREMARGLSLQRRAIDRGKYDTVPLAGETPQLIGPPAGGGPPGGAPSEPRPKAPPNE